MKENFLKGFSMGILVPMVAFYFFVTLVLHTDLKPGFEQLQRDNLLSQVMAISVLANALPIFVYNKRKEDEKLKGVVGASILYAVIVSVMYFL